MVGGYDANGSYGWLKLLIPAAPLFTGVNEWTRLCPAHGSYSKVHSNLGRSIFAEPNIQTVLP